MRVARRGSAAPALIALAMLVLAGCVTEGRPDDATCRAQEIELEVTLTADALSGDPLSVCREQEVEIVVASQVDGLLHIHGYDDEIPPTTVTAGESVTLRFSATRSGQFPIEVHPDDDPRGIGVGVLTVHEP
jgi:hypothetical protein